MDERKIIPIRTRSGLLIGGAYIPKPCPRRAVAFEHYTGGRRRFGVTGWVALSALAFLALCLIAGSR